MAFRSDIGALILGTVQVQPLHGYEIVRRIREAGGTGKLSEGQIYPYLHRLEEAGFVKAEWQTDIGGAPRRVYEITEGGLKELDRQRSQFERFASGVATILNATAKPKEAGNV